MNVKLFFFLFLSLIIIAFLAILFIPLILLGKSVWLTFVSDNLLFIVLLFFFTLLAASILFARMALLSFMENNQWGRATRILEKKCGRPLVFRWHVATLLSIYMVTDNRENRKKLADTLAAKQPRLYRHFSLSFGIEALQQADNETAINYYKQIIDPPFQAAWAKFIVAFLELNTDYHCSQKIFAAFARQKKHHLLALFSHYLLRNTPPDIAAAEEPIDGVFPAWRLTKARREWHKYSTKNSNALFFTALAPLARQVFAD